MDIAEYEKLLLQLSELDNSEIGEMRIGFGKFFGTSYSTVAICNPGYARWALSLTAPEHPDMLEFQSFLRQRTEITDQLERLDKQHKDKLKQLLHEQHVRDVRHREEVLKERMRTSRGDQLLSLTDDIGLFQQGVLVHLPLKSLLAIPSVCVTLRDAVAATGEWKKIVATAMARLRETLVPPPALGPQGMRLSSTRREDHDRMVRSFFGIKCRWWTTNPICFNSSGRLVGFEEHNHMGRVARQNQELYLNLRNEVRLAIKDWTAKRNAVRKHADDMNDRVLDAAKKLCISNKRVKDAMESVIKFHTKNAIAVDAKVAAVPAGGNVLDDWKAFASMKHE